VNVSTSYFGAELRRWRLLRGKSQFELADRAGYSQRHVSFLELGRSRPTRESVLTLAETLDVPLKERNTLLLSAGFAPLYSSEPLNSERIRSAIAALEQILQSSRPFPSMLVDRAWNIRAVNPNMQHMLQKFLAQPLGAGTPNALRLCLDPAGLRPAIANWPEFGRTFQNLVRRDLARDPENIELQSLLAALQQDPELARAHDRGFAPDPLPVASLVLEKGDSRVRLFTMVSALEEPGDATLSDLRVETFYPIDEESRKFLFDLDDEMRRNELRSD